jgi:anti-sigma factor RsiW
MPHDSEQHAQHDPLLVVSLVDGDLTGADRDLASSLIAECADCATLHNDLLAIARATTALPAAVRPRDFRLSPEQASRLRPAGWRRFIAAFASPRLAMIRQLGVGLTTLGLAGLLVSVLPTVQLGGMGAAAPAGAPAERLSTTESSSDSAAQAAPSAAPSAAAPGELFGGEPSATHDDVVTRVASDNPVPTSASDTRGLQAYGTAGQAPDDEKSAATNRDLSDQSSREQQGASLLIVASAILLAAGIALLVARRIARGVTGG